MSAAEHARREALLIACMDVCAPLAPNEAAMMTAVGLVLETLRDLDAVLDPI